MDQAFLSVALRINTNLLVAGINIFNQLHFIVKNFILSGLIFLNYITVAIQECYMKSCITYRVIYGCIPSFTTDYIFQLFQMPV